MSHGTRLKGLYVITDDKLTPNATLTEQVMQALEGRASIVQLRNKSHNEAQIRAWATQLQALCRKYEALFVLNDKIELAIELGVDGLHIGKSDHHRFDQIRRDFAGVIGVSCYADIPLAKQMQERGADYVAFGSFFPSPTKPSSNIIPLEILSQAREALDIPICAIGGIHQENIDAVMAHQPDMVSLISDIWNAPDISSRCQYYATLFEKENA